MLRPVYFLLALLVLFAPRCLRGQESPFLPRDLFDKLRNEISGDIAYDNLRQLTLYHSPSGGSRGFREEAEWVLKQARRYGLEDARYISLPVRKPKGSETQNWTPTGGELWLLEPEMIRLGSFLETPVVIADNSAPTEVTAELVDVGQGVDDRDYEGKDVSGRVVLAYGSVKKVEEQACKRRGALGIVSYYSSRVDPWGDYPDQIAWVGPEGLSESAGGDGPRHFAFMISPRRGLELSRWMNGRRFKYLFSPFPESQTQTQNFRVRVKIEAEISRPGTQGLVEGYIRGSQYHDRAVLLSAHLQEEKTSANDNRSGCASLLEITRALQTMIADGRLVRPKRDIRIWWVNEISAPYEYFSQHPEERAKVLANINQDMVGAKQSLGGRRQLVSRTPYSRWSYLNDVVESIVENLALSNNAYLVAWQAGGAVPFSRPVLAPLGSREPYRAQVVPYFDSTDHHVFNDTIIGVPGVSFTNWPDEYIHSTGDDLWQIDSTQLERNALAVAASALYLANLDEAEIPRLATVVSGAAQKRLEHDLEIGLARFAYAAASQRDAAFADALNLLDWAVARESLGLTSLYSFVAPSNSSPLYVDALRQELQAAAARGHARLAVAYRALTGASAPSTRPLTEKEKRLRQLIPTRIASVSEYLTQREDVVEPKALHELMRFEVLNYVDGKNSFLDIYHAVRAESLSAGEWYYGEVKLEDVEQVLESARAAKIIEVRERP